MSKVFNMSNILQLIFLFLVAIIITACGDRRPPEEITVERAEARWEKILSGDLESAWEFNTPGYRERVSATDFIIDMRGRPFRFHGADVHDVNCSDKRCELRVVVSFEVPVAPNQLSGFQSRQGVTEIWLFIDGQWWYSP